MNSTSNIQTLYVEPLDKFTWYTSEWEETNKLFRGI